MWFTEPDLGNHPTTLLLLNISWYYLILRLMECIETVIFVLRKKFSQVRIPPFLPCLMENIISSQVVRLGSLLVRENGG